MQVITIKPTIDKDHSSIVKLRQSLASRNLHNPSQLHSYPSWLLFPVVDVRSMSTEARRTPTAIRPYRVQVKVQTFSLTNQTYKLPILPPLPSPPLRIPIPQLTIQVLRTAPNQPAILALPPLMPAPTMTTDTEIQYLHHRARPVCIIVIPQAHPSSSQRSILSTPVFHVPYRW
jgi:hypothetical protein